MDYNDRYFQQDFFMDQLMAPPPPVAEYGYASGVDISYDNAYDNSFTTEYVTSYTNDYDTGYNTSYDTVYTHDTPYSYPYPMWGWYGYNGWYDNSYPRSYASYDGVTAVMLVVITLFVIAVILMYMDDDGLCDTVYGTVLDPRCKKHIRNKRNIHTSNNFGFTRTHTTYSTDTQYNCDMMVRYKYNGKDYIKDVSATGRYPYTPGSTIELKVKRDDPSYVHQSSVSTTMIAYALLVSCVFVVALC